LVNYKLFWYEALLYILNILKDMRIQSFQSSEASKLMWPQGYQCSLLKRAFICISPKYTLREKTQNWQF
jgi:hypothetical protein